MTEVKTQIKDLVCLKNTLQEQGYAFEEATVEQKVYARGWNNGKQAADLVIRTGSPYDVGLKLQSDGQYGFVADWWAIETYTGMNQQQWMRNILQTYSYNKVMAEVKKKGFQIVDQEQNEDKTMKVMVRRWA
ncbi:DUF1257 domain-containing protein [bacterium]|nr:DUF1257 domain-containing protein [bacterium]